jgi:hypothetical protein
MEENIWKQYEGKYLSVVKTLDNSKQLYYQGFVKQVFDDKLLITDRFKGDLILSFDKLEVLDCKEVEENEKSI